MLVYEIQEFAQKLADGKPLLGVDYGTKKTGLAISCGAYLVAAPLYTVATNQLLQSIKTTIQKYNICGIVVGLPLNMDGSKGSQAELVEKFALTLLELGQPIFMQDERRSSKAADLVIYDKGKGGDKDHIAASLILDTTLQKLKWCCAFSATDAFK